MRRTVFLFIAAFYGVFAACTSQGTFSVRHIGVREGLSQSQVLSVEQDHHGFLWIGTQDGLNRYDGIDIHVYRPQKESSFHLSDQHIQCLHEGNQGILWIGTVNGGLNAYTHKTGRITTIPFPDKLLDAPPKIGSILEDSEGIVWVGTIGKGLFRKSIQGDTLEPTSVGNGVDVRCLLEDEHRNVWIGTDTDGLFFFDRKKGTIISRPLLLCGKEIQNVFCMSGTLRDGFLVGTFGKGLYHLEPGSMKVSELDSAPLKDKRIWTLIEDRNRRFWAGTMDGGLYRVDSNLEINKVDTDRLGSKIWALLEDESGLIWAGTGDRGLYCIDPRPKAFETRAQPDHSNGNHANFVITSVCPSARVSGPPASEFWVGTWGLGLYHYNASTDEWHSVLDAETCDPATGKALITSLYEDPSGILWMGVWGRGLVRYSPEDKILKTFPVIGDGCNITVIREYEGHSLLLGTYGTGLVQWQEKRGMIHQWKNHSDGTDKGGDDDFPSDQVMSLLLDGDVLYTGTVGSGLVAVPLKEKGLERVRVIDTLDSDRVTCLVKDSQGTIWVGTDGDGLFNGSEKSGFNLCKAELPSDVINGMIVLADGNLWVSTNRGIVELSGNQEILRTFGAADGFQGEYNAGVFAHGGGRILFGGQAGLDVIEPEKIHSADYAPPVVLTRFLVFNEEVSLPGPIWSVEEVGIDYTKNFFSFEYAALDYSKPSNIRYAYKLDGFDKDWIDAGNRTYASYTNLASGDYVFRVKGTNGDQVWSSRQTAIRVSIAPPFYRTLFFRWLCVLCLLSLVFSGVWLVQRQKIMKNQREKERLKEISRMEAEGREAERVRMARELHDGAIQSLMALQFTLSMKALGAESIRENLKGVIRELRFICGALRPPALRHFGVEAACLSFQEELKERYPDLRISSTFNLPKGLLSKIQELTVFRIFQEALNNAVKHGQPDRITSLCHRAEGELELIIQDDGTGFKARSELISYSREGCYGLLGIEERLIALGGSIRIESTPEKGTRLIARFPLD